MRDQSNRRTRNEELRAFPRDKSLIKPRYPSWDMEELDLTARYMKVENYISKNEMNFNKPILNTNHKTNQNE